jgi:LacI family transcriptional regulator
MRAAEQLAELPELPTAVMCSNDMTAIGVLRSFVKAGIKVPDDISVIGFDDIHLAEFVYPPLTTVQMSRVAIAEAAFNALRSRVEGGDRAPSNRSPSISTQLIVRQSTGFPWNSLLQLKQSAPQFTKSISGNGKDAAVKTSGRARQKT